MSQRSKAWILAASGLVFAQAAVSLVLAKGFALTAISDITQCVLLMGGTIAFLLNVLSTRGRTRLFWALMTLGMASWLAYQLSWIYFEVLLRQDVPNPFVGDIILFLHIVPMIAALALQPQVEQDERTTRLGSLDFALLLVWWVFLYLYAVIPWQYAFRQETIYEHNLNALYLTEKLVLLGGLAVLWRRSADGWKTVFTHWFGALLLYALSSYLANWAIEHDVYYTGSLYDVPLAVSMAWIVGIGLLADDLRPTQGPKRASGTHGVWVARLGMATVFSLPLFAAWSLFDTAIPARIRTLRMMLSLATMTVMGAMVFLKQHLLDRELWQLLRGSQRSFDDLRRLQSQLVQSEKMASLGQLVGGAAHELNNPLTAMLGYSELLASSQLTEDERSLTDKIEQHVRRTQSLVSNLLTFAQRSPGEKILVDLNSVTRTALKICQPQIAARRVHVETQLAEGLPRVLGDSNLLLQVCLQLINQALPAMPKSGGMIQIRTDEQNQQVVLQFSDNGSFPSDPTAPDTDAGLDLSFGSCYGILQDHRGRILRENHPEGGARIRIELPVAGFSSAGQALPASELAMPLQPIP